VKGKFLRKYGDYSEGWKGNCFRRFADKIFIAIRNAGKKVFTEEYIQLEFDFPKIFLKRKIKKRGVAVCFILAVVMLLSAVVRSEVEVSGFADISADFPEGDNSSFNAGVFEVDLASEISEKVVFEGAAVIEEGEIGLGQTLVDFKIKQNKLGLRAGLFDVPFGLDYQVFAAPDRKFISPPLITDLIMDGGWSDTGVNLYAEITGLAADFYIVNGFGEYSGLPVNQDSDNNNAKTYGSRINFSPFSNIEAGASYAVGPYLNGNNSEVLFRNGVHLKYKIGAFEVKTEYMDAKEENSGQSDISQSGFYFQLIDRMNEKFSGGIRFCKWERIERFSLGIVYELERNVLLKSEYQINDEDFKVNNNVLFFQTVVSF